MKSSVYLSVRFARNIGWLVGMLLTGWLLVTCSSKAPEPLRPRASFRFANNNCTAPCDPGIANLSQYGLTYRWDFGDGGTATDETPTHTYTKGGSFPIKLTVTGEQNQVVDTTLTVTILSPLPTAAFTVQNDNCTAACEIVFVNQSQNAQSYQWDFGDGGTSTDAAPKHIYGKPGTFTAKLTVTGAQGKTSVATQTVTIKSPPVPVAAFTIQNDNCTVSCDISFQNQSQNAQSYQWNFGDGGTSTDAAPKHTYTKAGTFTVKLTATGALSQTASATQTVTIKSIPVPVAAFLIQNDNCIAPCTVVLQNQSTNSTAYSWTITTGYQSSKQYVSGYAPVTRTTTEQSPSQSYSNAPPYSNLVLNQLLPYTVILTATGPGGTQTVTKNSTIREPLPVADFTFSSNSLGKVTFTNKSVNATSYLWDFGNGTTSTDSDPVGSYGNSGSYTVTLQAKNGTGTNTIKKAVGVTVVK